MSRSAASSRGDVFALPLEARRALVAGAPGAGGEGRVGPYRLVRELGRGGAAVVYLAVRDDGHYRQRVALKVIHRDDDDLRRRCRRERQILAGLEHPCIARLLDGGETADGRPYLVMELVEGEPIDVYCRRHRLPLRRRLELFRQVCAAVEHAHQRLVVHRDLKPSNVLITDDGVPKLLDFGIAKLLGSWHDASGLRTTAPARRLLTPAYASPEQLRGEPVTTACDVYALGVLLYELTAGELPHGETAAEVWRRLEGVEAPLPSVRAGISSRLPPPEARARRRALRGDLDGIVMKALAPAPGDRYASVEQLADDLRRHLEHQPVRARSQTAAYRGLRWLRRHLWVSLGVLALAVFAALMTVQSIRATRALERADAEQARAEGVTAFLIELFAAAAPNAAGGDAATARQLLDLGARRLRASPEAPPEMRARLLETIAEAYEGLAQWRAAADLLEEAVAVRTGPGEAGGAGAPGAELAASLARLGRMRSALGDHERARELQERSLAMLRGLFGGEHPEVAAGLHGLGEVRHAAGDLAGAEALYRRALAMRLALLGDDHPAIAESLYELAALLRDRGDAAGAEPLMRRALALRRRHLGERHTEVALLENDLGMLLLAAGEPRRARPLIERAVAGYEALLGVDHVWASAARKNLARVQRELGELDAAEALLREVLASRRRALPPESPHVAWAAQELGLLLVARGELAAGEALLRESLESLRRTLPAGDWPIAAAEAALGACLLSQGRLEEAEGLLLAAHQSFVERLGSDHQRTRRAAERLEQLRAARAQGR